MKHFTLNLSLFLFYLSLATCGSITSAAQKDDSFPLAIIHINDFHARFEETNLASNTCKPGDKCIGGYARTVTVVKQLKEKHKDHHPIYLNAGDSFQGTLWYNFLRWNVTSHFLNILQADVMTIGNHEFDHGIEGVVPFLEHIKSPMVVANIDSTDEPTFQGHYNHSAIIIKDGRRIGIIGVVLQSYDILAKTEKLKFLDEVITVKEEAQKLHDDNVDIIIVLSHSGIEMDRKIAKEGGPYIDVIVGGHSHTFLYTGKPPGEDVPADVYPVIEEQPGGRKVYIVQASAFTKYVGELTVWFDAQGNVERTEGNPIYLSSDIVPDPQIVEELKPWKEAVDAIGNKVHGESKVLLEKPPCVRGECNIGNLVTDSYVDHFIRKAEQGEWTYASIALQNAGGIRTSLVKGSLIYADLIAVLPFENELIAFEIRGDKLLQALEYSVSKNGTSQSNMLQTSGLRTVFNLKKPAGERVGSVYALCRKCRIPKYEPLQLFEYYRVAMPSFLADGGDGFFWFKEFGINRIMAGIDIDIFTAYVERKSPLFNGIEGRIKMFSSIKDDLFPLAIIHINDFHARFEETDTKSNTCKTGENCIGGYARTVTVVKQLKEKHKDHNPIYLNAGDNYQGSLWYSFFRWNVTSHFLNLLKADVMTIGNHDFDHGISGVVPFLETLKSPMVIANVDSTDEPSFHGLYNHSVILEKGGRRIGIIGVVLHTFHEIAKTEKLTFSDEVTIVKEEAQKLHDENVDIIIVLSHSGIDVDRKIAREGGPYIDVIVGSHSHTLLYTGDPPGEDIPADVYPVVETQQDGRKVYVVQASAFTKYVGELTVWFDAQGNVEKTEGNPIYLSNNIVPDPEIIEELKPWKEAVDALSYKVHGKAKVQLRETPCKLGECALGNLITDSFVHSFVQQAENDEWTYASIAVINADGVRNNIEVGNVTYLDLFEVLPYENDLVAFEIRGDKLLQALEHGVSRNGPTQVNLLQVSGLKVTVNMKNEVGERVVAVQALCQKCKVPFFEDLDLFKYYRVIAQSYVANGGFGFTMFKNYGQNQRLGGFDSEAFVKYVEIVSPIVNTVQGRITFM